MADELRPTDTKEETAPCLEAEQPTAPARLHIPGLGMRAVKTAVAVMISYLVFVPFDLLYNTELGGIFGHMGPIYACVACVVCMQSSLGLAVKQGISRFIGIAIGGALSMLFAAILGDWLSYPAVKAAALGAVCMANIYLCLRLRHPGACVMSCVMACVILINDSAGFQYAAARMIETTIGAAIALGVNVLLPDHRQDAHGTDAEPPKHT